MYSVISLTLDCLFLFACQKPLFESVNLQRNLGDLGK